MRFKEKFFKLIQIGRIYEHIRIVNIFVNEIILLVAMKGAILVVKFIVYMGV